MKWTGIRATVRQSGTTELISLSTSGTPANADSFHPSVSDDGRFVAFRSNASNLVPGDTNERWDIFVRNRTLGTTTRISLPAAGQADNHSYRPVLSGDGSTVVFESDAANLSAGDTNNSKDVFTARASAAP